MSQAGSQDTTQRQRRGCKGFPEVHPGATSARSAQVGGRTQLSGRAVGPRARVSLSGTLKLGRPQGGRKAGH